MGEKLRLRQAVIVEGKYDKIKLDALLDAVILTTNGFGIFSNREQRELIRSLARQRGIIVLTDSDGAGFKIRGYLSGLVEPGQITHVYIPDFLGKEKRKAKPSAEGKLGVEGMDLAVLRRAFQQAGVLPEEGPRGPALTKWDLYDCGLCGGPDSRRLRELVFEELALPRRLGANAALPLLGGMMTAADLRALAEEKRRLL